MEWLFAGQDVDLWKWLFCDCRIRNTQAGMPVVPGLALISALCVCVSLIYAMLLEPHG